MLTEIYIEALLIDEELADQVWEAWDKGNINHCAACIACLLIAATIKDLHYHRKLMTYDKKFAY